MQSTYPSPMMVTLVYIALTVWLVMALTYFVANPFSIALPYLAAGYEVEDVLWYIFTPGRVGAYLLMELLVALYQWVMVYGYAAYGLGLARRSGPGYRTLLEGFSSLGRALGVSFFTALFTTLWSLLGMVPAGLFPQLRAGGAVVGVGVGGVLELPGQKAPRDLPAQLLRLGDGPGHALLPGGEHHLGAVGLQQGDALHAHGVRHGEHHPIAPGPANGRQADPRVAGGGLHNDPAGGEFPLPLRPLDHGQGHPVLAAPRRVQVLQLAQQGPLQPLGTGEPPGLQQGGAPHQLLDPFDHAFHVSRPFLNYYP